MYFLESNYVIETNLINVEKFDRLEKRSRSLIFIDLSQISNDFRIIFKKS